MRWCRKVEDNDEIEGSEEATMIQCFCGTLKGFSVVVVHREVHTFLEQDNPSSI